MNPEFKRWLTAGAWIALIFVVLSASVVTLDHFTAKPFADSVKKSVEEALQAAEQGFPMPSDPVSLGTSADPSTLAWKAVRAKKNTGYIFAARVTGNSGPWPVIFVYDSINGTVFAGIAGRNDGYADPERYGLTPRVLLSWRARFDSIAQNLEVKP